MKTLPFLFLIVLSCQFIDRDEVAFVKYSKPVKWPSVNSLQSPLEFSGYYKPQSTPTLTGSVDMREPIVFDLDSVSWGMVYNNDRLGFKWAKSSKADPHNWTKQNGYLIQSDPNGWDKEIADCGKPFYVSSANQWRFYYADYSGKVGLAVKNGEFGNGFVKYQVNPIIDNTGAVGAGNQFIRHISSVVEGDTVYLFFEGRKGGSGGDTQNGTAATDIQLYRAVSYDGINFTLDQNPVFNLDDYPNTGLVSNAVHTPEVSKLSDNRFYLMFHATPVDNKLGGCAQGLYYAVNDDISNNAGWQIKATMRPLLHKGQKATDFDSWNSSEPSWFEENANVWIYYTGSQSTFGISIGRFLLIQGAFDNTIQPSIMEDGFTDNSIDTSKWIVNSIGGITVTETNGGMKIAGNGTTQALTNILRGKVPVKSVSDAVWTITSTYKRNIVTGGSFEFGLSNLSGTNKILFTNDPANINNLYMKLVINGQTIYNKATGFSTQPTMVQIKKLGHVVGWWRYNGTKWANKTLNGNVDVGPEYIEAISWPDEDLYFVVNAANVSGKPYNVILDSFSLKDYDHSLQSPFIIN